MSSPRMLLVPAMLIAGFSVCFADAPHWPDPTADMRPWCYNWWMGNAVDAPGLTAQAQALAAAGFGGFHGIPVYEAKDPAHPPVDYLSDEWAARFKTAADAASDRHLGLDLSTGCGWCFGGPWLTPEQGIWRIQRESDPKKLKRGAQILWQGQDGEGRTVILAAYPSGMLVKRAPASGKGPMMDPFAPDVMQAHLKPFARVFDAPDAAKPRSMYHDSYEYYGAAWTPKFFAAFRAKRGYDLRDHLPAFAGVGEADEIRRIKHDYRETLSDLLLDTFGVWTDWCRTRGMLTRNEAHGSPANWLDFYALADIPETEMFNGDRDILVSKFAASAAHLKGTPRVSSESCTWINEHFNATLDETQVFLNQLLLAGVNHVFYHGCCYSPADAAWPGWCFYASLEMNPRNPIWHDVPILNAWLTRVQSLAQTATPDEDVLLYWPIHDTWRRADGYADEMSVHNAANGWFGGTAFGRLARRLTDAGVAFDYVSDRQLATLRPASETHWTTIVVPACETMPVATARSLQRLSAAGYRIVFEGDRPRDVPGWMAAAQERTTLATVLSAIPDDRDLATVGRREPFVAANGLAYRRLRQGGDTLYFLVANSNRDVNGCFCPSVTADQASLLDPMTGKISSINARNGVYINLSAGESVWLWISSEGGQTLAEQGLSPVKTKPQTTVSVLLDRGWTLTPVCGGPAGTGPARTMDKLVSWSRNADGSENPFSGTVRYQTSFTWPLTDDKLLVTDAPLALDLGRVCHSARVRVNGTDVGARIRAPYAFEIPREIVKDGENELEIEVTSTGANRIRELDRKKVDWKIFSDINMVGRDYKPFDAAAWPLAEAGLLGPVSVSVPRRPGPRSAGTDPLQIKQMSCEGLAWDMPIGVKRARPRFTWSYLGAEPVVRPLGTEVRVLTDGSQPTEVWRTVLTNELFSCVYGGQALKPATPYRWQVRALAADGTPMTAWSPEQTFVVALQDAGGWEGAQWVGESNGAPEWSDFDYEVKFSLVREAFGVYFRARSEHEGYMWQINSVLDKNEVLLRPHVFLPNGGLRFFEQVPLSRFFPQGLDWRQPHTLRIVARGQALETYLDGVKVHACQDAAWATGTVGVRTSSGEEAWVESVAVKTPDGQVAAADGFTGPVPALFPRGRVENGRLHLNGDFHLAGGKIPNNAIQVRKTFQLKKQEIRHAVASVCGLGFYELWLDGQKADPFRVMAPGMTDPSRASLFDTYDVTARLKETSGAHTIGLWLAPGYADDFSQWGWHWRKSKRGILHLNIVYADGSRETVVTDGSWELRDQSEILSASIYGGETCDARQADADWCRPTGRKDGWRPVVVHSLGEAGRLVANDAPPVWRCFPRKPQAIVETKPGVFVADFGQNRAGFVEMRVKGPAGTTVRLHTSELVGKDGNIDPWTNRNAASTDVFTLAGTGEVETYCPRFTYHGFRYVEITGWPGRPTADDLTAWAVYASVQPTGYFTCSDNGLNQFVNAANWSMLSNFVSYPTDCPMRDERTPCQMDSQAYEDAALEYFELSRYYSKWLDDIQGARGNPDWTGDACTLPMRLYWATGDVRILEDRYADMKGQVDDLVKKVPTLVYKDGFGDWCAPNKGTWESYHNDVPLVNTAIFCDMVKRVADAAEVLGRTDDVRTYRALRARAVAAFNKEFYHPDTKTYGDGSQATSVLPLAFDLVPPGERTAVYAKLVETIHTVDKDRVNVGIYGMRYLGDVLCDGGDADLFVKLMTQPDYPGFGYMFAHGATTLWEQWSFRGPMNSHNHAMFSGALYTVMTRLGGLRAGAPGWSAVTVAPVFPATLAKAREWRMTPHGFLSVSWRRDARGRPVVVLSRPPFVPLAFR